jgi:hypothetical protein
MIFERSGFREAHAHLGLVHADSDPRDDTLCAKLVERHIGALHRFSEAVLNRICTMGPNVHVVDQQQV